MKLLTASLYVLGYLGVIQAVDFPNDLYFHHHPEQLAKMNNKNQVHKNYARPHRYNYGGYREDDYPYHRASYHQDDRHYRSSHYKRDLEPRSNKAIYNSDGSINYSYKAAGPARSYYSRPRQDDYNRGRYSSQDDSYYGRSNQDRYNSGFEQDDRYNDRYDSRYSQDDRLEQEDRRFEQDDRYEDNYEQDYRYGGSYGGSYGQDDRYEDRYDEPDNRYGGDYRDGRHLDYYSNVDRHIEDEDDQFNHGQGRNTGPANVSAKYDKSMAGFGGGLRLAGALPDDGFSRGQGTFYDLETHVGICGRQSKNTEFVAAVNAKQMGESDRNNPNCGKEIEVVGPEGQTIKVKVVDKCKTCSENGLDLSPAAYEKLGEFSHGFVPIKWKFI